MGFSQLNNIFQIPAHYFILTDYRGNTFFLQIVTLPPPFFFFWILQLPTLVQAVLELTVFQAASFHCSPKGWVTVYTYGDALEKIVGYVQHVLLVNIKVTLKHSRLYPSQTLRMCFKEFVM